jgi:hypothetical protein
MSKVRVIRFVITGSMTIGAIGGAAVLVMLVRFMHS